MTDLEKQLADAPEPEKKPRRMGANPLMGKRGTSGHAVEHDWRPSCDFTPKCELGGEAMKPLEPADVLRKHNTERVG